MAAYCPTCDSEDCKCGFLELQSQLEDMVGPTPDADDLVALVSEANGSDAIAAVFTRSQPPSDPIARATIREKLLTVLTGKLKSPASMVDAWLRSSPEKEANALDREQAGAMVHLVLERAELLHTPDSEAYASIEFDGHIENHRIRGRRFRQWMMKLFFDAFQAENSSSGELADGGAPLTLRQLFSGLLGDKGSPVPGAQAVRDAIATLEGLGVFQGDELDVFVRIAEFGEHVFLDLANEHWEAIEITTTGWQVVSGPPVKFIRPEGMRPLPAPVKGGSLEQLRRFVNVEDGAWPLIAGFIAGMVRPRGPYIILNLLGEQGSAKSTAAKYIRRIVDPATPIHRARPRNEHDLVIGASRSWVLNFDNLSGLPDWFSDALCRLATGGGYGARLLYSDDEERLFDAQRPIILNGIEELATRGDLLDRSILVTLPILDGVRRERELDEEVEAAHPGILGAVLDAAVEALEGFDKIELEGKVRMADAAAWMVAAEEGLGLEPGSFMDAYRENRAESNALTLEASKVAAELLSFMDSRTEWRGTATNLLEALDLRASKETKQAEEWPKSGRGLSGKLRRLAPALRRSGLELEFDREGHERSRTIRIIKAAP